MFNKLITIFLYYIYLYGVSAVSLFIKEGQRPKLFELLDNEVGVVRITLDNEEFGLLKDRADFRGLSSARQNLTDSFKIVKEKLIYVLDGFNMNYTEWIPGYDFKNEIPELNIGDDGFPHLNYNEIIGGMDFNIKNYVNFDFVNDNLELHIYQSNPNFNITKINNKINDIANSINNPYRRDTYQTLILPLEEQLNNKTEKCDTDIKPLLSSIYTSNITLFNGVLINKNTNRDYIQQQLNAISISGENNININENNENENNENENNENENNENDNDEGDEGDEDDEGDETEYDPSENDYPDSFKTKIGSVTFEIGGEVYSFDEITFSLSGQYSRHLEKPNYNLKLRGGKDLFGRSQFKLRSDLTEPTYLRSKLTSDIHQRLGLKGISANYVTLYINGEYMGLYILVDSFKQSWAKHVYGDDDTYNLYKCNSGGFLNMESFLNCDNEHDFVNPYEDQQWIEFLTSLDKAESASDIEDIFEVDHFLYEMAIEYLLGGWDHLQLGHNYFMYKQPNGKWIYLSYDHDHEFGINLDRVFLGFIFDDLPEYVTSRNLNYPTYSFKEFTKELHIIDILILRDPSRFNKILKDVVEKVFNPATLFPHIDELKEFIKPYVELEFQTGENGKCPGCINDLSKNPYSFQHWEANSEFTTIETLQYNGYGIKYWILSKYRYVCKIYDIKCDPFYLDENYSFSIDKNLEFKGYFKY